MYEEDRPTHIARHNITIEEVLEILIGNYVTLHGRSGRRLVVGQTDDKKFLTIVVGERQQANTYGLVTARPARREERRIYITYFSQQGGDDEK